MKRLNFDVSDSMHDRMKLAIAEGKFMRMSELCRAGINRELDKLDIK